MLRRRRVTQDRLNLLVKMVGVKPVLCHNQNTVKQETKYNHTIEL